MCVIAHIMRVFAHVWGSGGGRQKPNAEGRRKCKSQIRRDGGNAKARCGGTECVGEFGEMGEIGIFFRFLLSFEKMSVSLHQIRETFGSKSGVCRCV